MIFDALAFRILRGVDFGSCRFVFVEPLLSRSLAYLSLFDHRAGPTTELAEHAQVVLVYLADVGAFDEEALLADLYAVRLKLHLVVSYLN